MLRILTYGDDEHRIESSDGIPVGWIRGRAIGFGGFADEAQAMHAATVGRRSLDGTLRRQFPGWTTPETTVDRVRLFDDGTGEWIADGDRRLARLYRLADVRPPRAALAALPGSLAIELELPSFASTGVAIAAAHLVGAVIHKEMDISGTAA